MNAGKALDEVDRISDRISERIHQLFLRAGPLRKTVITWRPEHEQFYSASETSLDRGIIQEHAGSYTLKTMKCLVIQNRIEQGDLK